MEASSCFSILSIQRLFAKFFSASYCDSFLRLLASSSTTASQFTTPSEFYTLSQPFVLLLASSSTTASQFTTPSEFYTLSQPFLQLLAVPPLATPRELSSTLAAMSREVQSFYFYRQLMSLIFYFFIIYSGREGSDFTTGDS